MKTTAAKSLSRRHHREMALMSLYHLESNPEVDADLVFDRTVQLTGHQDNEFPQPCASDYEFAREIYQGVNKHKQEIDTLISSKSRHWKLSRMPRTDLSLLRMATFELLYLNQIDPAVTINEIIEIAKKYSSSDSPSFINAILDQMHKSKPPVVQ